MKISELQLTNLIKHYLIIEFKERGIEGMCITEFLPLCAALLYPYKDAEIQSDNNNRGTIIPIINSVKKYTSRKDDLGKYSLKGLRSFFKYNWLPTLGFKDKVCFIKNISLIENVEENGFFSIKGNENVHDTFLHKISIIDISQNYGNDIFEVPVQNVASEGKVYNNENIEEETMPKAREEAVSLNPLKDFLLSNLPLNKFPKGLRQYDYFWEYRLSEDQYKALKGILKDLDLVNNVKLLKKEISGYGTVALSVVLFIAEWYKRECESLDGDRCLDSIGLSSKHSLTIWSKSGLPNEFLHQNENENQMRQIAICALGGLPIRYVTRSPRFKDFINRLSEINPGTETTDEEIEQIIACFDDYNGVFKRSLTSGSCKEYLLELVSYLESGDKSYLPFSETDTELPMFSVFIKNLQEGYGDLPKRFFKTEIRVWTYDYIEEGDDSQKIETEFYVRVGCGKDENKNVIMVSDLSRLGVNLPQDANIFEICLKLTQNDGTSIMSKERRTYFKIGNNCADFCGAYGSDITTSINLFDVKEITLLIVCGDYKKEIYHFSIPQYLELSSTNDFYLWTTRTNHAARKVLFYNTSEYTPQNVDDSEICFKSNKDNEWGWIYQKDIIHLLDKNDEIIEVPLGSSELIMVDFKAKNLKKNVALIADECVSSVIDGDPGEPVHLLYYSNGQELMLACDGLKGRELLNNYKLEYKYLRDNRYTEWTDNNRPSQGFIKLRITCRDISKKKRMWIGMVYFIPKTNIIRRNIENNYITFEGNDIRPTNDTLLNNFNTRNNKFKDSQDLGKDSSIISFRIGDDENHIIVDVYRAFRWLQIWNNETLIKDKIDGDEPPVAIILQKNIKIRSVNENGYNEHSPNYCEYINYFTDLMDIAFYERDNIISRGLIDGVSLTYRPYIYLSRYEDTSQGEIKVRKIEKEQNFIYLYVSDKHVDDYIFYYWSGMMKDVPIQLERIKIKDKKYQYIIPYTLDNNAVVFQSLSNCKPNMYFRPFYDGRWSWVNYIHRYDTVSIEYLLKCFDYAVEHNIYFCIFPALRKLQNRDLFTDFIRIYIQQKQYYLSNNDKKNLIRLAKELAMDWFFVDRKKMLSGLDEESKQKMRKCMKELLLCSPIERGEHAFSKRFIDRFLLDNIAFQQRSGKLPRQFLKVIDNFNSYDGCYNIENRIAFLTKLVNSEDNIFKELCRILNI